MSFHKKLKGEKTRLQNSRPNFSFEGVRSPKARETCACVRVCVRSRMNEVSQVKRLLFSKIYFMVRDDKPTPKYKPGLDQIYPEFSQFEQQLARLYVKTISPVRNIGQYNPDHCFCLEYMFPFVH